MTSLTAVMRKEKTGEVSKVSGKDRKERRTCDRIVVTFSGVHVGILEGWMECVGICVGW